VNRVNAKRIRYIRSLLHEAGLANDVNKITETLLYGVIMGEGLAFRAEGTVQRRHKLACTLCRILDTAEALLAESNVDTGLFPS